LGRGHESVQETNVNEHGEKAVGQRHEHRYGVPVPSASLPTASAFTHLARTAAAHRFPDLLGVAATAPRSWRWWSGVSASASRSWRWPSDGHLEDMVRFSLSVPETTARGTYPKAKPAAERHGAAMTGSGRVAARERRNRQPCRRRPRGGLQQAHLSSSPISRRR
jgi:hypothetical protein